MEQFLDALARKGSLRRALGIRTDGSPGLSVLESSLSASNLPTTRTLLERAGVWGFQGTRQTVACPLHTSILSKRGLFSSSPDDGFSISEVLRKPLEAVVDQMVGRGNFIPDLHM